MTFWAVIAILAQFAFFGALGISDDVDLMAILAIIAATSTLTLAVGVLAQRRVRYVSGKTLNERLGESN